MADYIRKTGCPTCGSSDACAEYNDGSTHCFSCSAHSGPGSVGDREEPAGPDAAPTASRRVPGGFLRPEIKAIPARRLTEETCRKFGYGIATRGGETVQVAPYYRDGELVAQKIRTRDKEFSLLGSGKALPLFGQQLWGEGGKRLVITEGEIDALAVSQLQQNKWPVVSVPNGSAGAAKAVARALSYIESFERVVFCFDMDEPGLEAAKACAPLLRPGKALIAALPLKDASECLVAGRGSEVIDALWRARTYRPDGIVDVASVEAGALTPIETGIDWPWEVLTKATYGIRRRELYGFGAGTGCGKSTVVKEIALHLMEKDHRVGLLMLEEAPTHTLRTLAGMKLGVRLHVPGAQDAVDQDDLREAMAWMRDRVYLYDHYGCAGWEAIADKIRYMVVALGIKDIFLDHLTALAASLDSDERKAIDKIMAALASLTQELDCTIYYISHLATPEGKPHEEGGRVLERHFRGSRAIGYWSNFLFALERDKQDCGGVTTFRVLKDRFTGDSTGLCFGLRYDIERGRQVVCALPDKTTPKEASSYFDNDF